MGCRWCSGAWPGESVGRGLDRDSGGCFLGGAGLIPVERLGFVLSNLSAQNADASGAVGGGKVGNGGLRSCLATHPWWEILGGPPAQSRSLSQEARIGYRHECGNDSHLGGGGNPRLCGTDGACADGRGDRLLSESIALAKRQAEEATLDGGFARDLEAMVNSNARAAG